MMDNCKWSYREHGGSEETFGKFCEQLGGNFPQFIAMMLYDRVDGDVNAVEHFFDPDLTMLHDPFGYKDMDKAIDRLCAAIDSGEKILVYGDYDVDGTTSVALVYSFLKKYCTHNIEYYVPDRYSEGYGVSFKGVDFATANGFSLIIALDCGIKDNPSVSYAASKCIDFIICDHHTPGVELPKAVAVIDAKRIDNTYPFDDLSGCGVGFKLLQALCIRRGIAQECLYEYLDLVAVSIVSDIVSMKGENRVLAYNGLKKINDNPMTFIRAIQMDSEQEKQYGGGGGGLSSPNGKAQSVQCKTITSDDLLFTVGPRINAAGRMRSGMDAVRLLISDDIDEASCFAKEISLYNKQRKLEDRNITESALQQLQQDPDNPNKCSTVVCGDGWHKGVVGIVASRLTESFYRPTIVLSRNGDMLTGSARSVSDFNIYDAIDSCHKYLTAFGGHKFAAGLSMKAEDYDGFRADFEDYVKAHIEEHQKYPTIMVDGELRFDEITNDFYNMLQQFQPFGPDNPDPIFATHGVVGCGGCRAVGKEKPPKHLHLEVMDSTGRVMSGIGFGLGHYADLLQSGARVDICYAISQNVYKGKTSLQLVVKDVKRSS